MDNKKYIYLNPIIDKLKIFLDKNNISQCHGFIHALSVLNNAINAIDKLNYELSDNQVKCILYASLLHDIDDHKFFSNKNNENLREILQDENNDIIEQVVKMINLVSSSKNGDNIDNIEEYMLIPRYSDRLEAIGIIGILRSFIYSLHTNTDIYTENTPRPKNINEIWNYATIKKYKNYRGKSKSMIDHFFDKVLRSGFFPITNSYLTEQTIDKNNENIDFILAFGNNLINSNEDIKNYILNKDPQLYYKYELYKI